MAMGHVVGRGYGRAPVLDLHLIRNIHLNFLRPPQFFKHIHDERILITRQHIIVHEFNDVISLLKYLPFFP